MKTSHLTAITARLNPFSPHSKIPRLFLSLLPPNAHRSIQIKTTQLPRTSSLPAQLELAFKDGKVMKWEWTGSESNRNANKLEGQTALADVVTEVNRHTRLLSRKEELQN